ncbi:hypothetical protein PSTT_02081 [Puccinia striiformis]|uniref:Uncharacterized protein n=3 Tax=Puccinia striiformis TaxID=27350 RepID=A0A2S4W158_9BASI|nr:hypothetical protein PSTT_02081 [Puccinia striiformis]
MFGPRRSGDSNLSSKVETLRIMDNIDLGGEDGEPRNSALNIELLMPYFDSADASMYELRVGQLMRFLLRNFTKKAKDQKEATL